MKKTIILLVIIVGLIAVAWYAWSIFRGGGEGQVKESVATVNGEPITRLDLEVVQSQVAINRNLTVATLDTDQLAQLQTQALNALISQALLRQAAEKAGITVSQEDIDAQIETIRGQFKNEKAYTTELASRNMTEQLLRINIGKELTIQAYLSQTLNLDSLTATQAETANAYKIAIQGKENPPTLKESRAQIERFVINQKQQNLINQHIQKLRADAQVETYI